MNKNDFFQAAVLFNQSIQDLTQFYGQTCISQWFVRKFLAIIMMIYGQTAIFAHFVRNRHFSSKLITDKASIFIDVSVNGRAFAKCSDW